MPFGSYREAFDAETLTVLEAAFNEAWSVLQASGVKLDEQAAKQALAELIVSLAAEGETDPKRLKALAIAELPRIAPHSDQGAT